MLDARSTTCQRRSLHTSMASPNSASTARPWTQPISRAQPCRSMSPPAWRCDVVRHEQGRSADQRADRRQVAGGTHHPAPRCATGERQFRTQPASGAVTTAPGVGHSRALSVRRGQAAYNTQRPSSGGCGRRTQNLGIHVLHAALHTGCAYLAVSAAVFVAALRRHDRLAYATATE